MPECFQHKNSDEVHHMTSYAEWETGIIEMLAKIRIKGKTLIASYDNEYQIPVCKNKKQALLHMQALEANLYANEPRYSLSFANIAAHVLQQTMGKVTTSQAADYDKWYREYTTKSKYDYDKIYSESLIYDIPLNKSPKPLFGEENNGKKTLLFTYGGNPKSILYFKLILDVTAHIPHQAKPSFRISKKNAISI